MSAVDGILLVDKPRGPTSHDVVLAVRRLLPRGVKVGHTGTLDPLATGLLVLVVGRATRAASEFQRLPKVYTGRVRFGIETVSGDLDGAIVRESAAPLIEAPGVREAMASFIGEQQMPPPIYSAVKYKGKPLYAYARKGVTVPLLPRPCRVFAWDLLDWTSPEASFRLDCSHGTYARSLAVGLGTKLGYPAVLSELRRERIGDHLLSDAATLETLRGLTGMELTARIRRVPETPRFA